MTNQPYHPPIILQATEAEFQAAIRKEFIEGSAIDPDQFEAAIKFWALLN